MPTIETGGTTFKLLSGSLMVHIYCLLPEPTAKAIINERDLSIQNSVLHAMKDAARLVLEKESGVTHTILGMFPSSED